MSFKPLAKVAAVVSSLLLFAGYISYHTTGSIWPGALAESPEAPAGEQHWMTVTHEPFLSDPPQYPRGPFDGPVVFAGGAPAPRPRTFISDPRIDPLERHPVLRPFPDYSDVKITHTLIDVRKLFLENSLTNISLGPIVLSKNPTPPDAAIDIADDNAALLPNPTSLHRTMMGSSKSGRVDLIPVTPPPPVSLSKSGEGRITLSGSKSYSGVVTITPGQLTVPLPKRTVLSGSKSTILAEPRPFEDALPPMPQKTNQP